MHPCQAILSGDQLSTLHHLLDSLSWLVNEKVYIQQKSEASSAGYEQMYRFAVKDKTNISFFPSSPTRKHPKVLAPNLKVDS